MITTKKHKRILAEWQNEVKLLREKLEKAENLKEILHKLQESTSKFDTVLGGYMSVADFETGLSDAIPRYVEDMLGGKVIKQEGTKVIQISSNGEVKTGLTKQPPDEGYTYKLIRG